MYVKTTSMNDFVTMLTTCLHNGISDIRVIMSSHPAAPNVSFGDCDKPYTRFSFVLFTPLYAAAYCDNLLHTEFDSEYKLLLDIQEQSEHAFSILVFESIKVESDCITVKNELKVV